MPKDEPQKNLELTTAQKHALSVYERLMHENHGRPPTYAQLAQALGVTRTTAFQLVRRLTDKGFIRPRVVTQRLTPKGERALPRKTRSC